MHLKFIAILASLGALGIATSGCVSEGGYYQSEYRPAVVHQTYRSQSDYRRHDDRRSSRDWRHDDRRSNRDWRRDDHRRSDRDRKDGYRSSRDHHDRCKPGDKRCDYRRM
jgi:hypothetical protein